MRKCSLSVASFHQMPNHCLLDCLGVKSNILSHICRVKITDSICQLENYKLLVLYPQLALPSNGFAM